MKNFFIFFLILGIFGSLFVSSLLINKEYNVETNSIKLFGNESEWKLIKATGEETNLTLWTANAKDKKTEIGFIIKDGMTYNTLQSKYLYDENDFLILDDKNKPIALKYETAKCDGKDCYHISLTDAQAINIDEYIKLGNQSIILEYTNELAEYQLLDNSCDENYRFCKAIIKTNLKENFTIFDDINFLVNKIRWYKIYLNTTGEVLNKSFFNYTSNKTEYYLEEAPEWSIYENQNISGEKIWKIEAEKRPSWTVDWIIDKFGITFTEWAIWGNISTGDEAEVILNSPPNNNISTTKNITFNCSANVSNGATLKNLSLYFINGGVLELNETIIMSEGAIYSNATSYGLNVDDSYGLVQTYFIYSNATTINSSHNSAVGSAGGTTYLKLFYNDTTTHSFSGVTYARTGEELSWNNPEINKQIDKIEVYVKENQPFYYWHYVSDFKTYNTPTEKTEIFYKMRANGINWTCEACDSDGVCGFALNNWTLNLDFPNITILSPSASVSSSAITINSTINASGTLDYCYYNITRGASTEKANTQLNCSEPNATYTLSGDATYVLNIWANTTGGISNFSSKTFTYAAPTGGGTSTGTGGAVTIITGTGNWSMETDSKGSSYQLNLIPGSTRTKDIYFRNNGNTIRKIKLSCKSDNNFCEYIDFSKTEFDLPNSRDVVTSISFTINLPEGITQKDFSANIYATDDMLNQGFISVIGTTKYNILSEFATKLFSSKDISGIKFPYFLIFLFSSSIIGTFFHYTIFKPKKIPGVFSVITAFIGGFVILMII